MQFQVKISFLLKKLKTKDPAAFLQGGAAQDDDTAAIEALITKRNEARASKDWAAADAARDELTRLGIVLEDTAQGTLWRRQ